MLLGQQMVAHVANLLRAAVSRPESPDQPYLTTLLKPQCCLALALTSLQSWTRNAMQQVNAARCPANALSLKWLA
jgi:hypothetical protein